MAIVIGTSALILVLSVFNGFEDMVKSIYSSFYTDLRVASATGKTITVSPEQLAKLKAVEGIKNFSLVVEEKALLQNGDYQSVVHLKGVDENYRYVSGVATHLVSGNYEIGSPESPLLIVGVGVENALGIQADRNIFAMQVYLPKRGTTEQIDLLSGISSDTLHSSAAFLIQQEFDNKYAITNIGFVKNALGWGANEYSDVEIVLKDADDADKIAEKLTAIFGKEYRIQNKYQQNQSLYAVMTMERWAVYAIASLILLVAAFNMIGALRMLSLEKQKDIAALHAMGANKQFIQKIFLSEGFLLAMIGAAVGLSIALLIVWLQIRYHLIPITEGSFLIDYFPVKLKLSDFVLVGGTVVVIALLASWSPSKKAAATDFSLKTD